MKQIEFIESDNLKKHSFIRHAFFTNNLEGSDNRYWFKNNDEQKDIIINNRSIAMNKINRDGFDLITLEQIHSNEILLINDYNKPKIEPRCDALVTKSKKIVLGIRTADCVPILIADPVNRIISAIHSGWMGAISGIVENTIDLMIDIGADTDNMIVAIGPCIRQNSYKVDRKFYEKFIDDDKNNHIFFDKNEDYIKFDLPCYVKSKISNFGIKNIEDCNINTYDDHRFPSHRKSTLINQKYIGGILSVISLDD